MPKKKEKKKSSRDYSLDLLRGIAVILMIITHVNGIFYQGDHVILRFFTWWGATVCFTMFLFVSASVNGMQIELGKINKKKTLHRLIKFMFAYYFTAFVLVSLRFGLNFAFDNFGEIVALFYVPEFIEFFLAFILYGFLLLAIPRKYLKYITDERVLIPLTIGVFIISKLIYPLQASSDLVIMLKFLTTGHGQLHAFGILSYFPVFALGLWWGGNKIRNPKSEDKTGFYLFVGSLMLYLFLLFSGLSIGNRWPPSLIFMMYGIWFSLGLILISDKLLKVRYVGEIVTFFGINAFSYFIVHIIVLYFIAYFVDWTRFSEIGTIIIMTLAFLFSTLFVYLNKSLSKSLSTSSHH